MNGLPEYPSPAGGRPLIFSHFPSKKPQKRIRAFRTSTAMSCPSPVLYLQIAATDTLFAARPSAAIEPQRIRLGIIGSCPYKVSFPPQSEVVIPTSART